MACKIGNWLRYMNNKEIMAVATTTAAAIMIAIMGSGL